MENEKLESFSWTITNSKFAIKAIDKSFLYYGETVIPQKIREFFNIDQYSNGDKINLQLIYHGKEYVANISFEKNFNRSKLRISKELISRINRNINEEDVIKNNVQAIFINDIYDVHKYYLKIVYEI